MSKTQRLTLNLHSTGDEPLALALRRACDRCRRRKTRCDGQKTCKSCFKAGFACEYLTQPKPLGRRPRKARGVEQHSLLVQQTIPPPPAEAVSQNYARKSPTASAEHVSPSNDSDESMLYPFPKDAFVDSSGYIQPGSYRSQVFTSRSNTWGYPPLNLYAPPINGGLPFDVNIGDLSPGIIPQEGLAQQSFDQTSESPFPSLDKIEPSPNWMVPTTVLVPYVRLFFERLYPVFPVLEKESLPSEESVSDKAHRSWDRYSLVTSLSAAVTVQLNILGSQCQPSSPAYSEWSGTPISSTPKAGEFYTAEFWIAQALQTRQQYDFMTDPDEATIMTSFFLFEYYGNKNQSKRAWYYLREAIGFALAIGLDDPDTYFELEPRASQRRCRLFWLLFITERAYALQHKSSAMLRSSIELPRVFESDNPKLIYGFVSLVNLFKSVDDKFLSLWKGHPSRISEPKQSWQRTFCAALGDQNINNVGEIVEIQRLDILITQQWLHLLAWQMQTRKMHSPLGMQGPADKSLTLDRKFPFTASRDTLQIVYKANRKSLESHGIGMEQKIFDIACCLSDVLQCSPKLNREAVSMGHKYLHGFMTLLSSFRGQESEYLQPLLTRATKTLAAELQVPAELPCPDRVGGIRTDWTDMTRGADATRGSSELVGSGIATA